MKKLTSFLTGIALVLVSGAVLATGNMKVKIVQAEDERTVVQVLNSIESHFEIEFKNEKGDIVFYKKTDAPSANYAKYYNFSMLEDGDYNLTVTGNAEKIENALRIKNGNVNVVNQKKVVDPFFTVAGDRLEMSWLNFGLEKPKVLLYDNKTLLFEKELNPEFTINYGLDLSKLKSGTYDAVLVSGSNFFEYQITK